MSMIHEELILCCEVILKDGVQCRVDLEMRGDVLESGRELVTEILQHRDDGDWGRGRGQDGE